LIDAEDIITSVKTYLSEITANSKSRLNNQIDAVNTAKGDTMLPNVSNLAADIILGQRSKEINIFKNGRINIDVIGEAKFIPELDKVAKSYTIELSYIVNDDFSSNVFLRALRMERVITDVMQSYFIESRDDGFIRGEIESSFTPESVYIGNTTARAIKSGVVYNIILF